MLGANLDAAGDVLTYLALWKVIFFNRLLLAWQWIWYVCAMVTHGIAALIAYVKFKKFYFVHSISDKLLGASQFILTYLLFFTRIGVHFMTFICSLASVAGIDAVLIVCLSKRANPAVLSVFQVGTINAKTKESRSEEEQEGETHNV